MGTPLHFEGIILGFSSVLLIALSRWLCIKGVYYFTRRVWVAFLILGIITLASSFFVEGLLLSSVLSVASFCFFWGIGEAFMQEKRIAKGWFPANPKHKYPKTT